MTKKTRTLLFLVFLFLFLLITPISIFYSQGYRLDFENKKVTKTGGLFIKAEPKQVEIYINDQLIKKTDFFFGSALIENLLPKKYKIEVKKEGYLNWEKSLEIKEKKVAEVKNLVLFPKNLNFNLFIPSQKNSAEVENFWFSPDEKKMVLKEKEAESWALKLYDLEENIKSQLISEKEISQKGADLLNLEFSENSKELYLDIEIKKPDKTFAKPQADSVKKTFVLKLDKLPAQLVEKEVVLPSENILASKKQNGDLYYLDKTGYLFKNDLKLNEIPFPVQVSSSTKPSEGQDEQKLEQLKTKYTLEVFQDFLFLIEGESLYLFPLASQNSTFEKLFENTKGLKISPDKKKLVFYSNSEIWILFLKEFLKDGERKKVGEKLFLVRLSEKIGNVFWLNSDYLVFNSGNNLKIVETDERDKVQTWDITNFPNPEIYFNGNNRKLYILSEGNLFASEKLF